MKFKKIVQRFLVPGSLLSIYYFYKYRCMVSPRAEIEFGPLLTIGRRTQISSFCKIKATDGPIKIGKNVSIATCAFISSHTSGIRIGDDCLIGPNVTIVAGNYRYDRIDTPIRLQGHTSTGIEIENNVLIGAGAVILDGARIRQGVIIAPNSVVSGNTSENVIIQGNPAKVVFTRR